MITVAEVIEGINQLQTEVAPFLTPSSRFADEELRDAKLRAWTKRAYEKLKGWGFSDEAEKGFGRRSFTVMYEGIPVRAKMRSDALIALRDELESHPEHYQAKISMAERSELPLIRPASTKAHKVFLGHGGNKVWARVQMHLKDELHLNVEAWESEPRAGKHSVEVLKGLLESCTFAVIVATKEDKTAEGPIRARQNVVHEIGLFQGRIGFDKVALLEQEGIEGFSNLAGLQVIPFSGERIEGAFYELDRMLKREGLMK